MEEQRRRTRTILRVAEAVILLIVVAYMLYSILVLKKPGPAYPFLITAGILLAWLIENVILPLKTGSFEGKTPAQMTAYRKYAALGLVGYLGLAYFALAASSSTGFYGAIVYVITTVTKRRFQDEFTNVPGTGDEDAIDVSYSEEGDASEQAESVDPLTLDAAGREERMKAAAQDEPADMKSRLQRLNELAEEIEETEL